MTRDDFTQYAPQARPARGLAFFALVLFVVAGLGHRFGAIGTVEFLTALGLTGVLGLLAFVLAMLALRRIWIEDDEGTGSAMAGLILSLIVLTPFGIGLYNAATHPRLYDVSTDRLMPPVFAVAQDQRDGQMNPITTISPAQAALINAAYTDLVGRIYALPLSDATQAVLRVADARGFTTLARGSLGRAGETTLEFTGASFLLGFPSDVAIRLRQEGQMTRVDMRSASRYGGHDQGENAKRIANFLGALDYEVDVLTGVIVEDDE